MPYPEHFQPILSTFLLWDRFAEDFTRDFKQAEPEVPPTENKLMYNINTPS